jgi:hypothetical protein
MDVINVMRPDWREWFTVMGDGRVDVNEARAELIALIANVPVERVTPLLTLRAGKDGAMHTRDDNRLNSPVQVAQLLGVYQPQTVELLTRWVQFAGPIKRLESTGYFGDIRRRLVLIVQNQKAIWRGELPSFLSWLVTANPHTISCSLERTAGPAGPAWRALPVNTPPTSGKARASLPKNLTVECSRCQLRILGCCLRGCMVSPSICATWRCCIWSASACV